MQAFLLLLGLALVSAQCRDLTLLNGSPWHDEGGSMYDCVWYSKSARCGTYGAFHFNEDMSANNACCVCGGGIVDQVLTAACEDTESSEGGKWHDEGGDKYDCEWYTTPLKGRCSKYGEKYAWDGKTAQEACCGCGGGDRLDGSGSGSYDAEDLGIPIFAKVRLHNVSLAQVGSGVHVELAKQFAKAYLFNEKDVVFAGAEDASLWVAAAQEYDEYGRPVRPEYNATKEYKEKVDAKFAVMGISKILQFEALLKRNAQTGVTKRLLRVVLPELKAVTIPPEPLSGDLTCLGMCGVGNRVEEDGKTCYCSHTCVRAGDCCPSYYVIPCGGNEAETSGPTSQPTISSGWAQWGLEPTPPPTAPTTQPTKRPTKQPTNSPPTRSPYTPIYQSGPKDPIVWSPPPSPEPAGPAGAGPGGGPIGASRYTTGDNSFMSRWINNNPSLPGNWVSQSSPSSDSFEQRLSRARASISRGSVVAVGDDGIDPSVGQSIGSVGQGVGQIIGSIGQSRPTAGDTTPSSFAIVPIFMTAGARFG